MLGFAYSIFLKLFYPTSVSLLLLLAAATRRVVSRSCLWMAITVCVGKNADGAASEKRPSVNFSAASISYDLLVQVAADPSR